MAKSLTDVVRFPSRVVRVDAQFAAYLIARAQRRRVTVTELTRELARALTRRQKVWAPQ